MPRTEKSEEAAIRCRGGPCEKIIEERLQSPCDLFEDYEKTFSPGLDKDGNCGVCGSEELDFGHEHMFRAGENGQRVYVMVFECGECGHENFEEDYYFECVCPEQCAAPDG